MRFGLFSFIKIFKKGIYKKHKFTTNQMDHFENVFQCDCKLFFFFRTDIYTIQLNLYIKDTRGNMKMSSCSLYTGKIYMHYTLMGKMRLPFIDSDLLYRCVL